MLNIDCKHAEEQEHSLERSLYFKCLRMVRVDVPGLGEGACNGQTDNPDGDFNVTIQSMPSNTQARADRESQNANETKPPCCCSGFLDAM
jgi:hypothetical protein